MERAPWLPLAEQRFSTGWLYWIVEFSTAMCFSWNNFELAEAPANPPAFFNVESSWLLRTRSPSIDIFICVSSSSSISVQCVRSLVLPSLETVRTEPPAMRFVQQLHFVYNGQKLLFRKIINAWKKWRRHDTNTISVIVKAAYIFIFCF